MKAIRIYLSVLFLGIAIAAQGQVILEPEAFNRMIIQDITHAIVGENTPVTGIKIDFSKPEGTISGMFPVKSKKIPWDIFSFELKGGASDKNFSLLKGIENANSAFEVKPSFHFFTTLNSAKYGEPPLNIPSKALLVARNELANAERTRILDTIYTVTLLYNHHLKALGEVKSSPPGFDGPISEHASIAAKLMPKIINNPDLKITSGLTWDQTLTYLPQARVNGNNQIDSSTFFDVILTLFKKYEKRMKNLDEETLDKKILNASSIWTRKKYFWVTISPIVKTDKSNEYHTKFEQRDSLYFKPVYHWSYGGSINMNRYWVTPSKLAVLLRGTASLIRTNNLSNLSTFNYESRSAFFQDGITSTEKSKTGSAYNQSDVNEGFESKLSAELYILPLTSFVPGLYMSSSVAKSSLFNLATVVGRSDDDFKAGLESGLVFNINNKDKDKTLLSIITYFRYEDLTDNIRTSTKTGKAETKGEFQDRNMSVGVKVGVPITLPKRTE